MSDLIRKILIFSCLVVGLFLAFYIIRYIYRLFTNYNPMVQSTISDKKNLINFNNHIEKTILNSTDFSESYVNKFNVKRSHSNYINMHLYKNLFDNRLFTSDGNGNFYRNLNNT